LKCSQICGDHKVVEGEECDDGNTIDNDYCTNQCKSQSPPVISGAVAGLLGGIGGVVVVAGIAAAIVVSKGSAAAAAGPALAASSANVAHEGIGSSEISTTLTINMGSNLYCDLLHLFIS
jgi:cysteine-rich repeat protein